MVHHLYPSGRLRQKNRRGLALTAALVAISMCPLAFFVNVQGTDMPVDVETSASISVPAQVATVQPVLQEHSREIIEPRLTLSAEALGFGRNAPLESRFLPFAAPRVASVEPPATEGPAQPLSPQPEQAIRQAIHPIPLPVPRPPELRLAKTPETPKAASRQAGPVRAANLAQPDASADKPSFFERLFGIKPANQPQGTLSYASIDPNKIMPDSRFGETPSIGEKTAIYNISAKVVIMPNGERLEAHSGLGDKMDDPRYVHVRMKGPTPPGTYMLTEREALFHGVRALRMHPVGGSAAIFGRNGILAHSYLLGPRGDSNGCISFKDYDRFLQAYLRGEVKRIVVVTGTGQDPLPRIVNRTRVASGA